MAKPNETIALEDKFFTGIAGEDYSIEDLENALDQGMNVDATLEGEGCEINLLATFMINDDARFVKTLLACKPNLEQMLMVEHETKVTSLMVAIYSKSYDMAQLVLEAGANPNAENIIEKGGVGKTALMVLLENLETDLDFKCDDNLKANALKTVVSLLEARAKVSLKNEDGRTALDLAQGLGDSSIITLLEANLKKEKQEAFNLKAQKQKVVFQENIQKISGNKALKPRRRPISNGKSV